MRLSDMDFAALLPSWMAEDAADAALGGAVEAAAAEIAEASGLLTVWDRLEELPEAVLDELAWALSIEWWDPSAPLDVKRNLIRQSDLVHAKKGTPAAVEAVIRTYFGEGRVEEWFEYGGRPHHYRIATPNPTLVHENRDRFLALLARVVRRSSKLDSITIGLEQTACLRAGAAAGTVDRETAVIDQRCVWRNCGAAVSEGETVTVDMTGEE